MSEGECGRTRPSLRRWTPRDGGLQHWEVSQIPYNLHPTSYTLHLTPCTLHLTPYTLHPEPYSVNPAT